MSVMLKDCIQINDRFQNSINLSLDHGHSEKVESYIPTQSSLSILERYLDCVLGDKKEHSTILIGPYGKGKSHLLLVLLSFLSGKENAHLFEKIQKVSPEVSEKLKKIADRKTRLLPIFLSDVQEDLNQSFLLALHEALKREGLSELVPDTYFSEAIQTIESWKQEYPAVYQEFCHRLLDYGEEIKTFIRKLLRYEKKSYHLFCELYPEYTAGSRFQPMIHMGAMYLYSSVNRILCEKYGYSGVFLVFDEFSKYLEGHCVESISKDMKILQDMCELANISSPDQQIHLCFVAHKSIREYGNLLPPHILHAYEGVEGRITEVFFVTSAKNSYELIADVIEKKENIYKEYRKQKPNLEEQITKHSFPLAGFSSSFSFEEFKRLLVRGCFPLLPLSSYFLLHISERVAQNERTLFTFLSKDEPNSLPDYVNRHECGENWEIGMPYIYDYFKPLFQKNTADSNIHNEWLKTEYALTRTQKKEEKDLLKTLALIRMLHISKEVEATKKVLLIGANLSEEEGQKALQHLEEEQILIFRKKFGVYDFRNTIGVNIEKEISKIQEQFYQEIPICEACNELSEFFYEMPRRHNQRFAITRYFRYQFLYTDDFLRIEDFKLLFKNREPGQFADGKIILLIPDEWKQERGGETKKQGWQLKKVVYSRQKEIKEKLLHSNGGCVAVIEPLYFDTAICYMLSKIKAICHLKQNEEFLEQNRVLKEELMLYEEDARFELNHSLESLYLPKDGNCIVYTKEQIYQKEMSAVQYNKILSDMFDQYYNQTPKINHELINRNQLSSPIARARIEILEELLSKKTQDELNEFFAHGTGPEATIYRATLWHTGLLKKEEREIEQQQNPIWKVIQEIEKFFMGAEGKRNNFSSLYEVLHETPYGIRDGVIPIYLAFELRRFTQKTENMPVIYRGEKELELSAKLLEQISKVPSQYELWMEEGTSSKDAYLKNLFVLFSDYGKRQNFDSSEPRQVLNALISWYRSLPQYAMISENPGGFWKEEEKGGLKEFRDLLKKQDLNPRETLFEKIPAIFSEEVEYEYCFESIKDWKVRFENSLCAIKQKAAQEIKKLFSCEQKDDLKQVLVEWRKRQDMVVYQMVHDTRTDQFLQYIKIFDTHDEEAIVERLSRIFLNLFVEDWNDDSLSVFLERIEKCKQEMEGLKESKKIQEQEKRREIRFIGRDGTVVEKSFKALSEKQGSSTYLFRNSLIGLLDEFGESVDQNTKVAVLVEVLETLFS